MPVLRASWYGRYKNPRTGRTWVDPTDNNAPASGIPNVVPSIAIQAPTLSNARGKRYYYELTFPNGARVVALHGDRGPGVAGRLDVNARAADDAGYTPGNFPTDSPIHYRLLGTKLPAGVRLGRQGAGRAPVAPSGPSSVRAVSPAQFVSVAAASSQPLPTLQRVTGPQVGSVPLPTPMAMPTVRLPAPVAQPIPRLRLGSGPLDVLRALRSGGGR